MKERIEAIDDLRLSCSALYTAVPESVADDVKRRAEAVIKTHEAEIERLRGALRELVFLKDEKGKSITGDEYYDRKPIAWQKAREALKGSGNDE